MATCYRGTKAYIVQGGGREIQAGPHLFFFRMDLASTQWGLLDIPLCSRAAGKPVGVAFFSVLFLSGR